MTRSIVVLFLVLVQTTSFQTHALYSCGTIGNSNEKRVIARRDQMFYLNTDNPAPCTGNITSWRVCHYKPVDQSRLRAHWGSYAVYRKMGSGGAEQYIRVSDVYRAVRATRELIDRVFDPTIVDGEVVDGYMCYSDSIDIGDSPFVVQAGDVLGACVYRDPDRPALYQLDMVGEVNGESLLAMASNVAGCTAGILPSIISANQLSIINARRLHLYADIEPNLVPCKVALNAVNTSLQQSNIELGTLSISQMISSSTLSVSPMISSSTLSVSPAISSYTLPILPMISSSKLSISPRISSHTLSILSTSSSTLSISPTMSSSTLSISPTISSYTLSILPTTSSSTLSISRTMSSSTLSISPTISSYIYTLSILPMTSSSTLSISPTISSSTLSISPMISSSVLSLCYATYRRTTSRTTTSQLSKFSQSTPTSGTTSLGQGMSGSERLAGIVAGTVVGALLLIVSLVVIISVTLFLHLKKLKKERDKNSFNINYNSAYIEEGTDDSTQFNSRNVTANVNAGYNVHPVQAPEQDVWSHCFQHGHREILPIPIKSIAFNMNQNFVYTRPALPAPPALGVLPAAIGEPQNLDLEEDNIYETIT